MGSRILLRPSRRVFAHSSAITLLNRSLALMRTKGRARQRIDERGLSSTTLKRWGEAEECPAPPKFQGRPPSTIPSWASKRAVGERSGRVPIGRPEAIGGVPAAGDDAVRQGAAYGGIGLSVFRSAHAFGSFPEVEVGRSEVYRQSSRPALTASRREGDAAKHTQGSGRLKPRTHPAVAIAAGRRRVRAPAPSPRRPVLLRHAACR